MKRTTLIAMSLAEVLGFLITPIMLPEIGKDLDASSVELQWMFNVYGLGVAATLIVGGRLGDRFGWRRVFVLSSTVFGVAAASAALAQSAAWLIASSAAMGLAAGIVLAMSVAIVRQTFAPDERARAFGFYFAIAGAASAASMPIAGFLTDYLSWRSVYLASVLIIGLAIVLTMISTPARPVAAPPRLPAVQLGLMVAGITALAFGLMQSGTFGWDSPVTIGVLAGAVLAFAALALSIRRSDDPLIDPRLLADRRFAAAMAVSFSVNFVEMSFLLFVVFYLQTVLGFSASTTGLLLLPSWVLITVLPPITGRLSTRVGPGPFLVLGPALITAGMLVFSQASVDSTYLSLLPGFLLFGAGFGAAQQPIVSVALARAKDRAIGVASGVTGTANYLGGAIGVAAVSAVIAQLESDRLPRLLAATPGKVPTDAAEDVDGLLAQTQAAEKVLARLPAEAAQTLERLVTETFTYAFANAMYFTAGLALAALLIAVGLLESPRRWGRARRSRPSRRDDLSSPDASSHRGDGSGSGIDRAGSQGG